MLKERETVVRRSLIALDGFVVSASFVLSHLLRQNLHFLSRLHILPSSSQAIEPTAAISEYILILIIVAPFWCAMLSANKMYYPMRTRRPHEIIWIVIKSTFFSALCFGSVAFIFKLNFVSRAFFVIFTGMSLTFLVLEKTLIYSLMHFVRLQGRNYRRLLIVGTGPRAAAFIKKIQGHPEWGLKILGAINDDRDRNVESVQGVRVIGYLDQLSRILHSLSVDEVIFVIPRLRLTAIEGAIGDCEIEGVKATIAVDLFDLKIAKSRQSELEGIPLLTFETTVGKEWQLFVKRGMDLAYSGMMMLILSPLFLLVALLIKLTSPGKLLYKQERMGLNGRRFTLYKFRTMYKDAEQKLKELEALNEMKGPVFKIKRDPRITPVGRVLRKFSIDEFPQLFNVLIGHMSLIGPRPPLPGEVAQYETWQRRRLSMRPGLTCLWQVSGRNRIDFDQWMKLDLEYLDNWSLWLDLKIFFKTIPVVLFGIGAY